MQNFVTKLSYSIVCLVQMDDPIFHLNGPNILWVRRDS